MDAVIKGHKITSKAFSATYIIRLGDTTRSVGDTQYNIYALYREVALVYMHCSDTPGLTIDYVYKFISRRLIMSRFIGRFNRLILVDNTRSVHVF